MADVTAASPQGEEKKATDGPAPEEAKSNTEKPQEEGKKEVQTGSSGAKGGEEKEGEEKQGVHEEEEIPQVLDTNDPDHPIKRRIREAFEPFDSENNNTCDEREVRSIMRYLGAYPTEEDVSNDIIKQIKEDEEIRVRYDRFEEFMIKVLKKNLYQPDDRDTILQAFRVLDPEGKGEIDEQVIVEALTSNNFAFHDKEVEDFLSVAKDSRTGKIHYEAYLEQMMSNVI